MTSAINHNQIRSWRVAVLMATYNGERFIREQIMSILCQYEVKVHIFISDDCSNDSTIQIVDEIKEEHGSITIVNKHQKFGSAGRNFVNLIASECYDDFDYVALADQDDIWLPNKLIQAVTCIKAKGLEAYSANVIAFWDQKTKAKAIVKSQKMRQFDHIFEAAGPGCTYVFTKPSLKSFSQKFYGRPDLLLGVFQHDCLLYFYYRQVGLKWYIDSRFVMLYRQHDSNDFGISSSFLGAYKRLKTIFSGDAKRLVLSHFKFYDDGKVNVKSRLFLLKNFQQLRRHWFDRIILCILILIGIY